MAFLRGSVEITSYEAVLYSHWLYTLQLLKTGISWEAIQKMSSDEINLILGVEMAIKQMMNMQGLWLPVRQACLILGG